VSRLDNFEIDDRERYDLMGMPYVRPVRRARQAKQFDWAVTEEDMEQARQEWDLKREHGRVRQVRRG